MGLSCPRPAPGRAERLDQARAAVGQAEAERRHLANQMSFEVADARQRLVSARETVDVVHRAEGQAKEALRIAQDRYQEGLTTITEVLRAQTAFVRARLNVLAARYEVYVGYARILLAAGQLTDVAPFASSERRVSSEGEQR